MDAVVEHRAVDAVVEHRAVDAGVTDLGTAPVAVGRASGRNPVPVVVPCRRVGGSDRGPGGYTAADGAGTKRRLLELERRVANGLSSRASRTRRRRRITQNANTPEPDDRPWNSSRWAGRRCD